MACTSCQNSAYVEGLGEDDLKLFGGAVAGYVATSYVDNMLQYETDGTPKAPMIFKDNPKNELYARNGAYVAGGLALAHYMGEDEPLAKGAGVGMCVYGAKNIIASLIEKKEDEAVSGHGHYHDISATQQHQIQRAMNHVANLPSMEMRTKAPVAKADQPQKMAVEEYF